jgi:hypothetical protein
MASDASTSKDLSISTVKGTVDHSVGLISYCVPGTGTQLYLCYKLMLPRARHALGRMVTQSLLFKKLTISWYSMLE